MKMPRELVSFTMFALSSLAQAAPVQVKVESHSLGETAEQFFSESKEGVMLNACTTKDFGKVNRTIKKAAKEYCASLSNIRQRMVGGESGDYTDELSADDTKTTTAISMALPSSVTKISGSPRPMPSRWMSSPVPTAGRR
jgi:hypothetical protein